MRRMTTMLLGVMGLAFVGSGPAGCSNTEQMAERTALAEWGVLSQNEDGQYGRIYTYFPEAQVYYNAIQDRYFWHESGAWKSGSQLPPSVKLGQGQPVIVELFTSRPQTEHAEVIAMYPPSGQFGPGHAVASVDID